MKRLAALLVLLFAVALAAEKPLAVATIEPYASLARAVLGEGWRVESLVPAGANPHVFNPTPADVKKVASAELVIMNGLGFDEWVVDKLVRPNNLKTRVYRAEDSVQGMILLLPSGAPDPHVWTDPVAMTFVVGDLAKLAAELDPDHASEYQERARAYKLELFNLSETNTVRLARAPTRIFVAYKNPFSYIANRYRLSRAYLIAPNPAAEPTPRELAEAAKVLKAHGLRYLVAPLQTAEEARRVAEMLGVEAVFIDLLGETNPDYLQVWDANGRALARALGLEE